MSAINIRHPLEGLPADFSKLVGKPTLMRMAFEAIDATNWPRPMPPEENRTPEPVLRTLLGYCYCTGVFSSREIVASAQVDPSVRYLCANDFPTWGQVRQFRRQNVSHLRETLARMLRAICEEFGEPVGASFFPFIAEADRRLGLAVEADSAAMDD
jgi:hypothetical protein